MAGRRCCCSGVCRKAGCGTCVRLLLYVLYVYRRPEELLEHELCEELAVVERQHPGLILSLAGLTPPDPLHAKPHHPHQQQKQAPAAAGRGKGLVGGGGALLGLALAPASSASSGLLTPLPEATTAVAAAPFGARRSETYHNGFRHRVLLRGLRLKVGR